MEVVYFSKKGRNFFHYYTLPGTRKN